MGGLEPDLFFYGLHDFFITLSDYLGRRIIRRSNHDDTLSGAPVWHHLIWQAGTACMADQALIAVFLGSPLVSGMADLAFAVFLWWMGFRHWALREMKPKIPAGHAIVDKVAKIQIRVGARFASLIP